ncbi:MAG: hypothetical protein OEM91_14805, partial [Hyphomicrobiales bacterium]|nr:hypothetical protein [Hyphomicrobiales bacterium]
IETFVINAAHPDKQLAKKAARAPSLILSQADLGRFRPQRGKVYAGRAVNKAMQSRRLRDHGVPTPLARTFIGNQHYSEEEFGPLVMVKVTKLGLASRGTGIKLVQTRNLSKYKYDLRLLEEQTGAPVLIQAFIDTGKFPSTYRVLTLFGETLYIKKRTLAKPFEFPALATEVVTDKGMITNLEHGKGSGNSELVREADIAALAKEAAAAFPESPIIGVDILREGKTNKPYVIEMNIGNTWHFSSATPGRHRGRALSDFFNSWDVAADILVEKTLSEAE